MSEFYDNPAVLPEYRYILGSESPRRRELLKGLDISFSTTSLNADESFSPDMSLAEVPEFLARVKSDAYGILKDNELLITADTIVLLDGKIINKPENESDAFEMLKCLSNREHMVITGVNLRKTNESTSFSEQTTVAFDTLSDDMIRYYIERYKPYDKAGGYGIQEWIGFVGIRSIFGCYYNVMGLPLNRLYKELCAF